MRLLLLAIVLASGFFVKINEVFADQVVLDQQKDFWTFDHDEIEKRALISVSAQSAHSMQDIYNLFGSVLHFPAWYGHNLDALEELLSDPEYTHQKIEIRIYDQAILRRQLGEENMRKFLDVLRAASEANVDSLGKSRLSIIYYP